ncbi:MAG: hypothetical protein KKD74_04425 [Bacteroidetes bacterium]|nr:hypothetical protein [Bacteroidota bacterium]
MKFNINWRMVRKVFHRYSGEVHDERTVLIIRKPADSSHSEALDSMDKAIRAIENGAVASSDEIHKLRTSFNLLKEKEDIRVVKDKIIK